LLSRESNLLNIFIGQIILFNMELEKTKYNCFKCDGLQGDCKGSYVFPADTTCIWKQMAERDLEMYRKGENDLVLPEMLDEFVRSKTDKINLESLPSL